MSTQSSTLCEHKSNLSPVAQPGSNHQRQQSHTIVLSAGTVLWCQSPSASLAFHPTCSPLNDTHPINLSDSILNLSHPKLRKLLGSTNLSTPYAPQIKPKINSSTDNDELPTHMILLQRAMQQSWQLPASHISYAGRMACGSSMYQCVPHAGTACHTFCHTVM